MRTPESIIDDIGERKIQLELAQEGYAEAETASVRAHYDAICRLEFDEIEELEEELEEAFTAEENEG
jgi:hypothetical protein